MLDEESAVKDPDNDLTRYRGKYRPNVSNLTFIMWAAIISTVLILVSIALGVGIDPDMSMLASP